MVHRSNYSVEQWLIQWEGFPISEATWEDKKHILTSFPDWNLADKVFLGGEGIVVNEVSEQQGPMGVARPNDQQEPRRSLRARINSKRFDDFVMNDMSATTKSAKGYLLEN
ncbi:hypothetical protein V6Z12_A08G090100 [Gossypium hirsutum]